MKSILLNLGLICGLLVISLAPSYAQRIIDWNLLSKVTYATVFDDEAGHVYNKTIFAQEINELNGQQVEIKGYLIPMDAQGRAFALSAFPYSSCFFCGGGARESVIEIQLANFDREFMLDEIIVFRGTLNLNDDPYGLCYQLFEAVPVE
ncbi:DUF3299 domain-containing protein [Pontibacter sp. G13]|uniref:DUF3299 domain-containing protein n=1 Tax=Pontibacter sp. G13 TaxID=3074898 RepID=UPI00288C2E70|nr:DUF3299 domain-containing protein [Pontibacter sp. G13]WNJ18217.1 DUF3299 domain-containing protein [Pontibacter sp. G13]